MELSHLKGELSPEFTDEIEELLSEVIEKDLEVLKLTEIIEGQSLCTINTSFMKEKKRPKRD